MWEGQALPHDTKFGNSRCEIVGRRVIFIWSLIHGLRWSGLIKAEPDKRIYNNEFMLGMDQAMNIISYLLYKWLQTEYRDQNTVEPLYNTIVFHQNTHKRHPIARP